MKGASPNQFQNVGDLMAFIGDKVKSPTPGQPSTTPKPATSPSTTKPVASPSYSASRPLMASRDLLRALESRLLEAPGDASEPPKVTAAVTPLRYQAATVVAKTLGGSRISGPSIDFRLSSGTPEQLVNYGLRAFLRVSHTPESWHNAGRMLQLARQMGINWNDAMLTPTHRKVMDLG